MRYRRSLLTRWSRRDRLAIVVVATITALLVGSTLVVVAAGGEVETIAGHLNSTESVATYPDVATARADAPSNAVVLPITVGTVSGADGTLAGENATVVGVPKTGAHPDLALSTHPPPGTVLAPESHANATLTVSGPAGSARLEARHREAVGVVPSWWYVGTAETVEQIGSTGALVVSPSLTHTATAGSDVRDAPLVSGLAFFVRGTQQLLDGLTAMTAGVGVLVGVVVFSVTRMTVNDRLTTIAVLRATGLPRARLLGLFGLRAGLLTAVGVGGGAAVGVVLTNGAVNAAVFLGVPTTLTLQVTPAVVRTLGPVLLGVIAVGTAAGIGATVPTVRTSPAAVARAAGGGREAGSTGRLSAIDGRFRPRILPVHAVVPTVATLAVFVAVVLVAATLAGTLSPLAASSQSAVVQGGSGHPWSSSVDADYATVLRADGVAASPEILVFSVLDGDPFLTRGAEFDSFANLSDASLVAGRAPSSPDEVVVGDDLATALEVSVGDTVPLGGSNRRSMARVTVVGRYRAPGLFDDQLVVPLPTARHLSNTGPDRVNLIRVADPRAAGASTPPNATSDADGTIPPSEPSHRVTVVDVVAPERVTVNESFDVEISVANDGARTATRTLDVELGEETRRVTPTLEPGDRRTVTVTFETGAAGTYELAVANRGRQVRVLNGTTLQLSPLPTDAPANATVLVRVTDGTETPVANATVAIGDGTGRTAADGWAAVRLPASGTDHFAASKAGYETATHEIAAGSTTERRLLGELVVEPTVADVFERPTATLRLWNPWNRTLRRSVTVRGSSPRTRTVEVGAGERTVVSVTLDRVGVGTHDVTASSDGRRLDETSYDVRGDDRLVAALATGGEHETVESGLGRAASSALGNLRVLLGTLVALAGLATVASTTAAFARTVHSRRQTIGVHRATGATPRQVLLTVLGDAVRIAVPATGLAIAVGYLAVWLLARVGVLTAFGVSLVPVVSPLAILLVGIGALALALVGATVATLAFVRAQPMELLEPDDRRGPRETGGESDA